MARGSSAEEFERISQRRKVVLGKCLTKNNQLLFPLSCANKTEGYCLDKRKNVTNFCTEKEVWLEEQGNLPQCCSSLKSLQSSCLLHTWAAAIHFPLLQRNLSPVQLSTTKANDLLGCSFRVVLFCKPKYARQHETPRRLWLQIAFAFFYKFVWNRNRKTFLYLTGIPAQSNENFDLHPKNWVTLTYNFWHSDPYE